MAIEEAAPGTDAGAFEHLFDDWLDPIYAFVARRVEDREAAEEVTTRTFERAIQSLSSGRIPVEELPRFLLRVASSAVVDHARRRRRDLPPGLRASDLDEPGDAEAAAWLADAEAARAFAAAVDGIALRRAVLRLNDNDLRVVLLHYLDGFDLDAVAAALACSREEAASRSRRALGSLHAEHPRADANVA